MVIKFEGEPYVVMDYQHVAPGNWRAMVQVKMRHLKQGHVKENRFRSEDKVEQVFVEGIAMEYLYQEGEHYVFMNLKTYDQIMLNKEVIGDGLGYLKPNTEVLVNYYDGEAISILMPNTVDLKVIETEPGLKGATVTNVYKMAKLETGISIQVPPFVGNGEVIRVDTREGKYIERVREGGNKF
jgi:elongation factor P